MRPLAKGIGQQLCPHLHDARPLPPAPCKRRMRRSCSGKSVQPRSCARLSSRLRKRSVRLPWSPLPPQGQQLRSRRAHGRTPRMRTSTGRSERLCFLGSGSSSSSTTTNTSTSKHPSPSCNATTAGLPARESHTTRTTTLVRHNLLHPPSLPPCSWAQQQAVTHACSTHPHTWLLPPQQDMLMSTHSLVVHHMRQQPLHSRRARPKTSAAAQLLLLCQRQRPPPMCGRSMRQHTSLQRPKPKLLPSRAPLPLPCLGRLMRRRWRS